MNRGHRDIDLIRHMESEMARVADEALKGFFADVATPGRFWQPRADVHETGDAVVVKVELAGIDPDRLNVSLSSDGRTLTVSGDRPEADVAQKGLLRCYQLEIYFGPFERQIMLPGDVRIDADHIEARYRDGFLVVVLPKRAVRSADTRTIQVDES